MKQGDGLVNSFIFADDIHSLNNFNNNINSVYIIIILISNVIQTSCFVLLWLWVFLFFAVCFLFLFIIFLFYSNDFDSVTVSCKGENKGWERRVHYLHLHLMLPLFIFLVSSRLLLRFLFLSNILNLYFKIAEIGNFHYGAGHPMKPHRVRMAHNLIVTYGLYKSMEVFRPSPATQADLTRFHSDDYVNFLRLVTPDNMNQYLRQLQRFNVGEDCPVFDGLFDFCQIYTR